MFIVNDIAKCASFTNRQIHVIIYQTDITMVPQYIYMYLNYGLNQCHHNVEKADIMQQMNIVVSFVIDLSIKIFPWNSMEINFAYNGIVFKVLKGQN